MGDDLAGRKGGDVPDYLPPWPDWSKLPTNTDKPALRRPWGRIGLAVAATAALWMLWHVDPLVVLAFMFGLLPILRRKNPPQ